MIGSLDPQKKKVIVVGGGISGLLCAYYLDKKGYEVHLYEASSRAGGLIDTVETPYGIAEHAAHSLLVNPTAKKLFKELRIKLYPVSQQSRARYILREGRLRKMPLSISELLQTFWSALTRPSKGHYHSLQEWGEHHLGKKAVRYLLAPFLTGVYGASPAEISPHAAFPKLVPPKGRTLLWHLLKNRRKKKEGRPQMMVPRAGMDSLIRTLETVLEERLGSRFHLGEAMENVSHSDANVVLCTPAYEAGKLLKTVAPDLSERLRLVKYTPLIASTAFIRKEAFPHGKNPAGVGVLIPRSERRKILGVLFNSSAFQNRVKLPQEYDSFTVMLGGTRQSKMVNLPEKDIEEKVEAELSHLFSLSRPVEHIHVWKQARAVPVYSSELEQTWKVASETWCAQPGRVLFGNYTGQVSIRGMIDSAAKLGAAQH